MDNIARVSVLRTLRRTWPIAVCALVLVIAFWVLATSGTSRAAHDRAQIMTLIGRKSSDIQGVLESSGGNWAGQYTTEQDLRRDLVWFSPKPHIQFQNRVIHYRMGGPFGAGNVLLYTDVKDVVYAVHFMEDAAPASKLK